MSVCPQFIVWSSHISTPRKVGWLEKDCSSAGQGPFKRLAFPHHMKQTPHKWEMFYGKQKVQWTGKWSPSEGQVPLSVSATEQRDKKILW